MHVETMGADADELTRRGKPLAMASGGDPLIENAAGNKDDDDANEPHAVIVPSIGRRSMLSTYRSRIHVDSLDGPASIWLN